MYSRRATPAAAEAYLFYENGAGRIGLVVLVFLVLMYYFDLYNSYILTNRREVVTRLVGVLGTTFVALALLYYTFPDASLGGSVLWSGILAVAVVVPAWRTIFFVLNRSERFAERTLIYGDGPLATPLIDAIAQRPELGLRVSGYVGSAPQIAGIPIVEGSELTEFVRREGIRRIIVTMGDRRGKLSVGELLKLKASGVLDPGRPRVLRDDDGKDSVGIVAAELVAVFAGISRASRTAALQATVLAVLRGIGRGPQFAAYGSWRRLPFVWIRRAP